MIWTSNLAYVVGLITTDGSLSKDGRHLDFTSKDIDQIKTLMEILNLTNKIGEKYSSNDKGNVCYRVQFGNVRFYRFLLKIGLTPNKSKTLKSVKVPKKYFADFLRGCFDGDGSTYSYFDKRWKNSYMIYSSFTSASFEFLYWLESKMSNYYNLSGKIGKLSKSGFQLRFAKKSSVMLFKVMYYQEDLPHLRRKRFKINQSLNILESLKQAEVAKLVDAQS